MLSRLRFYAFLLLVVCSACHTQKKLATEKRGKSIIVPDPLLEVMAIPDTAGKFAKVVFDSAFYNFGTIKEGEKFATQIHFTNQGPGDLVIELVSACECTTLDWPRLPVKAGKRGTIKIDYNSKGKEGPQTVDVDIIANTDPIVTYTTFRLNVIKP